MSSRLPGFVALGALLLTAPTVRAETAPLPPEHLQAESQLIITGQVVSHQEDDREGSDGSVIRTVTLSVKIETVLKGETEAKPGDVIRAACWAMVREPREGPVYDGGHASIPGDGGRAKFYLKGGGRVWTVIYPNGVECLDSTPPLKLAPVKVAPAAPDGLLRWAIVGGAALLVVLIATVWLVARRPRPRASVLPAMLGALILTCSYAGAAKPPLTPEQLLAESKVIVVGKVTSHELSDEEHGNGAKTRWVKLRVTIESVVKSEAPPPPGVPSMSGTPPKDTGPPDGGVALPKGRPDPKLGESLDVRCWVLIRPPSEGDVVSNGHLQIPADGGRAKFYLIGLLPGGVWSVIVPNGVELLDQTPPLSFATEPALPRESEESAASAAPNHALEVGIAVAVVLGLLLTAYLWFRWSQGRAPATPASPA
jgi:hypothetical protein